MQDEIQSEYGRIAVVTTDPPDVNGALRAGLAASFPFLSDASREAARSLDLLELTDARHVPYLPYTFVLDSLLRIERFWCGFWYWGNPTPEELRQSLREITRRQQPTFDPQAVWARGGAPLGAGIDAPSIWVREDAEGHETSRGVHDGPALHEGDVHAPGVGGRPSWLVHRIERNADRVAYRLRREHSPEGSR